MCICAFIRSFSHEPVLNSNSSGLRERVLPSSVSHFRVSSLALLSSGEVVYQDSHFTLLTLLVSLVRYGVVGMNAVSGWINAVFHDMAG